MAGMRRLYRVLMWLLPPRVRQRHGAHAEQTFAAQMEAERADGGRFAAAKLAARECADLTASAVRERWGGDPLSGPGAGPSESLWSRVRRVLSAAWSDARLAVRVLTRQPAYSVASALTLALGIGANVAVFSVVWHVLLAPTPYRDADRLVSVYMVTDRTNRGSLSALDVRDMADQTRTFEQLAFYYPATSNLTGAGEAERLSGARVSGNFFDVLRAAPAAGRWLNEQEATAGDPVVVLSYDLWQRQFSGAQDVIGQRITLSNQAMTVVGVMPETGALPEEAEFWSPIVWEPDDFAPNQRGARYLRSIGRLQPDVTIEQAQLDAERIWTQLSQDYPKTNQGASVAVVPLREAQTEGVRPALIALSVAVALVLLIACSNIANLTLTRGLARTGEVAVRTSLGASRWRLMSQLLIEGLVLSTAGAAIAVLLASWGITSILAIVPEGLPRMQTVTIDWPVLVFLGGITVVSALVFSVIPAWQASRSDVAQLVREGGTRSVTRGHSIRRLLAVVEVAMAVTLVGTAGLLARTMSELQQINPGFTSERILTFNVTLPSDPYDSAARRTQVFDRITTDIQTVPGVNAVALGFGVPFAAYSVDTSFDVEGIETPEGEDLEANLRLIGPGYFKTLSIPVVSGRPLDETDRADSELVAVISAGTARRYFGDLDPIGRRLRVHVSLTDDARRGYRTVVGVVGDVRARSLTTDPRPEIYVPYAQHAVGAGTLVVRSDGDPTALINTIRTRVRAIDPALPIASVRTLDALVASSTARQRLAAVLLTVFAIVAIVLAAIGLYGVFSVGVSQRSHEIGIRMALGADRRKVESLFVREGLMLTTLGSALGVGGALAASSLIESLLVGVSARDPLTLSVAWVLLTMISVAACYIPARRASRVNPINVLQA